MHDINLWAVLAAAVSSFLLGGIWYGPLFKSPWCREAGIDLNKVNGHAVRVFGTAFVAALLSAFALAWFLWPKPNLSIALLKGLTAGLAIVATSFAINYSFAGRSLKLWLIDGGYHTVQFVLYGLILGLWH